MLVSLLIITLMIVISTNGLLTRYGTFSHHKNPPNYIHPGTYLNENDEEEKNLDSKYNIPNLFDISEQQKKINYRIPTNLPSLNNLINSETSNSKFIVNTGSSFGDRYLQARETNTNPYDFDSKLDSTGHDEMTPMNGGFTSNILGLPTDTSNFGAEDNSNKFDNENINNELIHSSSDINGNIDNLYNPLKTKISESSFQTNNNQEFKENINHLNPVESKSNNLKVENTPNKLSSKENSDFNKYTDNLDIKNTDKLFNNRFNYENKDKMSANEKHLYSQLMSGISSDMKKSYLLPKAEHKLNLKVDPRSNNFDSISVAPKFVDSSVKSNLEIPDIKLKPDIFSSDNTFFDDTSKLTNNDDLKYNDLDIITLGDNVSPYKVDADFALKNNKELHLPGISNFDNKQDLPLLSAHNIFKTNVNPIVNFSEIYGISPETFKQVNEFDDSVLNSNKYNDLPGIYNEKAHSITKMDVKDKNINSPFNKYTESINHVNKLNQNPNNKYEIPNFANMPVNKIPYNDNPNSDLYSHTQIPVPYNEFAQTEVDNTLYPYNNRHNNLRFQILATKNPNEFDWNNVQNEKNLKIQEIPNIHVPMEFSDLDKSNPNKIININMNDPNKIKPTRGPTYNNMRFPYHEISELDSTGHNKYEIPYENSEENDELSDLNKKVELDLSGMISSFISKLNEKPNDKNKNEPTKVVTNYDFASNKPVFKEQIKNGKGPNNYVHDLIKFNAPPGKGEPKAYQVSSNPRLSERIQHDDYKTPTKNSNEKGESPKNKFEDIPNKFRENLGAVPKTVYSYMHNKNLSPYEPPKISHNSNNNVKLSEEDEDKDDIMKSNENDDLNNANKLNYHFANNKDYNEAPSISYPKAEKSHEDEFQDIVSSKNDQNDYNENFENDDMLNFMNKDDYSNEASDYSNTDTGNTKTKANTPFKDEPEYENLIDPNKEYEKLNKQHFKPKQGNQFDFDNEIPENLFKPIQSDSGFQNDYETLEEPKPVEISKPSAVIQMKAPIKNMNYHQDTEENIQNSRGPPNFNGGNRYSQDNYHFKTQNEKKNWNIPQTKLYNGKQINYKPIFSVNAEQDNPKNNQYTPNKLNNMKGKYQTSLESNGNGHKNQLHIEEVDENNKINKIKDNNNDINQEINSLIKNPGVLASLGINQNNDATLDKNIDLNANDIKNIPHRNKYNLKNPTYYYGVPHISPNLDKQEKVHLSNSNPRGETKKKGLFRDVEQQASNFIFGASLPEPKFNLNNNLGVHYFRRNYISDTPDSVNNMKFRTIPIKYYYHNKPSYFRSDEDFGFEKKSDCNKPNLLSTLLRKNIFNVVGGVQLSNINNDMPPELRQHAMPNGNLHDKIQPIGCDLKNIANNLKPNLGTKQPGKRIKTSAEYFSFPKKRLHLYKQKSERKFIKPKFNKHQYIKVNTLKSYLGNNYQTQTYSSGNEVFSPNINDLIHKANRREKLHINPKSIKLNNKNKNLLFFTGSSENEINKKYLTHQNILPVKIKPEILTQSFETTVNPDFLSNENIVSFSNTDTKLSDTKK